ncbi:MAG: hypothetical protein KY475_02810 [Planctomycetes bacterium]|nr:hypothetical protein [Planctomycetota bacterium]
MEVPATLAELTLKDLALLDACYLRLSYGDAKSIKDAAEQIPCDYKTLRRIVEKVNSLAQKPVIHPTQGHTTALGEDAKDFFREVRNILNRLGGNRGVLRVQVAAGVAVLASVMPRVSRRFREDYQADIEYADGLPRSLLDAVKDGVVDLALVAVGRSFKIPRECEGEVIDFPLALIGPVGHSAFEEIRKLKAAYGDSDAPFEAEAKGKRFWTAFWGALGSQIVGLLCHRDPMPSYPERSSSSVRITQYPNQLLLHADAAFGGVFAISLPQLLTESQRARVDVVRLPLPPVHIASPEKPEAL